jgi:hypothetical protein
VTSASGLAVEQTHHSGFLNRGAVTSRRCIASALARRGPEGAEWAHPALHEWHCARERLRLLAATIASRQERGPAHLLTEHVGRNAPGSCEDPPPACLVFAIASIVT